MFVSPLLSQWGIGNGATASDAAVARFVVRAGASSGLPSTHSLLRQSKDNLMNLALFPSFETCRLGRRVDTTTCPCGLPLVLLRMPCVGQPRTRRARESSRTSLQETSGALTGAGRVPLTGKLLQTASLRLLQIPRLMPGVCACCTGAARMGACRFASASPTALQSAP